jgi:hypothetical protein
MNKLIVSLAALALTSGCGASVGQTKLSMLLTDAPLDIALAQELKVTIDEVKVHVAVSGDSAADAGDAGEEAEESDGGSAAAAASGKSGWKTVCSTPAEFDLLSLTNGKTTPMCAEASVDSGRLTQVRLVVSSGVITWKDGSAATQLDIPSGVIKLVGNQELTAGGSVSMTLDFDAAKSVVSAGAKFQLKPTIKIVQ